MAKKRKSQSKLSRRSIYLGLAVIVVLIAAALISWHEYNIHNVSNNTQNNGIRPRNTINYSPPPKSDNQPNNVRKSTSGTEPQTLNNNPSSPAPNFSVTVTSANVESSSQNVRVSTLINGATSGSCTVTFSQSGQQSVTANDQVTLQTNSYVCPVFNIPFSQFPTGGKWNVSVSVSSNGSTATGQWADNPITINK